MAVCGSILDTSVEELNTQFRDGWIVASVQCYQLSVLASYVNGSFFVSDNIDKIGIYVNR